MANYVSAMPLWAIVLFIGSFLYSIFFIAKRAKQAAINAGMALNKAWAIQYGVFGFYVLYFAYVSILSLKGVLSAAAMPPRVAIFTTLPLTILLFLIIGNTRLFKKLLRSITLESLITIHIFRVIGVFFVLLYFYHLLPANVAFSGEMGDIITALLAFPVANIVSKGKSWSIKAVYAWNIFGILDIVNVLILVAIATQDSILTGNHGVLEMTIFPFVWFPAFAPATILFLHTAVFRKLHQIKTVETSSSLLQ
jgi:hypothetical protein